MGRLPSSRRQITLDERTIKRIVGQALAEDHGAGDLTSAMVVPKGTHCHGTIIAQEDGIAAGLPVADVVFAGLDPKVDFHALLREGDHITKGQRLAEVIGSARAILAGERTALNFLQRMCGIATATAQCVAAVVGTKAEITDTRKTAPGLRVLDKYAVQCGGGRPHRMHLGDGVLIKDNHLRLAEGIAQAVKAARSQLLQDVEIEVEAETPDQVREALDAGADVILLDNMTLPTLREAVALVAGRAILEASGGIAPENVAEVAATGVDRVSIGALTHSVRALDLSMEVEQV